MRRQFKLALYFMAGLILGGYAAFSNAAVAQGYFFGGKCYPNDVGATNAMFGSSAPVLTKDADGISRIRYYELDNDATAWRMVIRVNADGSETIESRTIAEYFPHFSRCDLTMDLYASQSFLLPVVLFFAAFGGFKTGYRP